MWCGDKRFAHKAGFAFCFGMSINQLIKITCCVQRPWVLDSRLTPPASVMDTATGYSFPSGHTQSGMTVFGCLAKRFGGITFKSICLLCAVTVGVSRMYFRVHTPWDVAVSFVIGILVIFATDRIYEMCEKREVFTLVAGCVISIAMVVFALVKPYPAYHLPEYVYDCSKIAGAIGGFIVAWFWERRYVKYVSKGSMWQNILKTMVSLLVLLAIKLAFDKLFGKSNTNMYLEHSKMYLEHFALLFWCIGLSPYIMKKLNI